MKGLYPHDVEIGSEKYRPAICIIRTKNKDGTPGLLEHLRANDKADLAQDTEFTVVYVPKETWKS